MKRNIIIFDVDGVLFDSSGLVTKYLAENYPDMTGDIQKKILTGNFHEEIAKLEIVKKEETEEEKVARKLQYAKDKSESPLYDGVKELLLDLYNKEYILVLNTSAYERNCLPMLERAEIVSLFDFIATAEVSKSKVEKFKMITEKYDSENDVFIFVTDTLGDVREAETAEMPTIAVTWGVHDKSYFIQEPHTNLVAIVSSIDELERTIEDFIKKE